ncbi:MAG: hypothetical protein AAB110_05955, partial [Candidatus Desantisbacteria bacterium]
NAYQLNDDKGEEGERGEKKAGFIKSNLLASYIHIHFGTQLSLAQNFINNCRKYKEVRMERRKQRW